MLIPIALEQRSSSWLIEVRCFHNADLNGVADFKLAVMPAKVLLSCAYQSACIQNQFILAISQHTTDDCGYDAIATYTGNT